MIHYRGLGDAGYLIARDPVGKLLFFSRLRTQDVGTEQMDSSARRLGLFVEQEFGAIPEFQAHDATESSDDAVAVAQLSQLKGGTTLNLVPRALRTRQRMLQWRHRAFALLCVALLAAFYLTMPQINKKTDARVRPQRTQCHDSGADLRG